MARQIFTKTSSVELVSGQELCYQNGRERRLQRRPVLTTRTQEVRMGAKDIRVISPKWEARFWAKVDICGPDECWPWRAGKNPDGYGLYGIYPNGAAGSHVIALVCRDGSKPPPPANHAIHSCDNRSCCNPSHLRWGTHQENMKDRESRSVFKSRGSSFENCTNKKITLEQARFIKSSELMGIELAAMFGIHKATVSDIKLGKTWKVLNG